ncbi:hypothetical protein HAX54_004862, partial [Datura stramonium]|nr:hypothetical protein [Datura stramonium]
MVHQKPTTLRQQDKNEKAKDKTLVRCGEEHWHSTGQASTLRNFPLGTQYGVVAAYIPPSLLVKHIHIGYYDVEHILMP